MRDVRAKRTMYVKANRRCMGYGVVLVLAGAARTMLCLVHTWVYVCMFGLVSMAHVWRHGAELASWG